MFYYCRYFEFDLSFYTFAIIFLNKTNIQRRKKSITTNILIRVSSVNRAVEAFAFFNNLTPFGGVCGFWSFLRSKSYLKLPNIDSAFSKWIDVVLCTINIDLQVTYRPLVHTYWEFDIQLSRRHTNLMCHISKDIVYNNKLHWHKSHFNRGATPKDC
jgi:hypothetical protein